MQNNFDQTGAHSESPRVNPNVEVLYDGPTEFDPDDDEDPTVAYAKKPYIYPSTIGKKSVFILTLYKKLFSHLIVWAIHADIYGALDRK
jgi:hypothetical protein